MASTQASEGLWFVYIMGKPSLTTYLQHLAHIVECPLVVLNVDDETAYIAIEDWLTVTDPGRQALERQDSDPLLLPVSVFPVDTENRPNYSDDCLDPSAGSKLTSPRRIMPTMELDLRLMKSVLTHLPVTAAFGQKGKAWEQVALDVNNGRMGYMPASSAQARCALLLKGGEHFKTGTSEEAMKLVAYVKDVNDLVTTHDKKACDEEVRREMVNAKSKAFLETGLQRVKERREAEKSKAEDQATPDDFKRPRRRAGDPPPFHGSFWFAAT